MSHLVLSHLSLVVGKHSRLCVKSAACVLHGVALNPHSVVLAVIVVMILIIPLKQPIASLTLVIFFFLFDVRIIVAIDLLHIAVHSVTLCADTHNRS
jgi:hypothetical protein